MKIAHLADIHYCPKHLKWVDRSMHAAIERAIDEECDLAVIAGDSFDAGMGAHEPAFRAYLERVVRLSSAMPVIDLQGTLSHDRPGMLAVLRAIPTRYPVLVADEPGVWVLDTWQWHRVLGATQLTDTAAAVVCCLPSLNKADPTVQQIGARAYVEHLMADFRILAEAAREQGIPSILVTHGTVSGSVTESNFAMVSPDHEFTTETLWSAGTDAVMLGHIHKHQSWLDSGRVIAYPGSLARLVHGDHEPKGWCLWEIKPDNARYWFVEAPTRQLLEIEFDGPPDMDDLATLAKQAGENDAVRIRWTVDAEFSALIDKAAIRTLFGHCDSVKIEATVLDVQSVRAAGISRALTLEDKLGYYLKTTGDEQKHQALADRLQRLQTATPEEIVRSLLSDGAEIEKKAA